MTSRNETGQASAELGLMLPLLLLILLGCIDLGRAFSVWMTLANGTREGARYACLFPKDTSEIVVRTQADVEAEGLSAGNLRVQVSAPSGYAGGSPVVVTARYTVPLITSFLFGGQPVTIRATTQMVIVGGT